MDGRPSVDSIAYLTASDSLKHVQETGGRSGASENAQAAVISTRSMTDVDFEIPKNRDVDVGELLDGSISDSWFVKNKRKERKEDGRSRLLSADGGPRLQRAWFSGRSWMHGCELPMPLREELIAMDFEMRSRDVEADDGPVAKEWLKRVDDWVYSLELFFRGTSRKVARAWRDNIDEWEKLLQALPKTRRDRVLRMIREGVKLPWDGRKPAHLRDPKTGGCPRNNPRLREQRGKVWDTLYEQLVEEAVAPWDCQGRCDNDVLPKGMYAMNWQVKHGSDKVRITANMRPLKKLLCPGYSEGVDLPSVQGCRLQHKRYDLSVEFDLHSSYHHGRYHPSAYTWLGFSVEDAELPPEAVEYLWKCHPQCRFKDRWVFVYHTFAMGASPSVADFQEIMQAAVDASLMSGVGESLGLKVEAWRGFLFIDDIKASASGGPQAGTPQGGFGQAIELGLNLMATLISLGCFVNFKKSRIVPRQKDNIFLGIAHDSIRMRFFLPSKRKEKLDRTFQELRSLARVGGLVDAKAVARAVGLLWSIHVVCHKAVAIMCRGMIRTLAVMLKRPQMLFAIGGPNFKWILKQAWRGSVVWTQEAEEDLKFWLSVPWDDLWAPFGFDLLVEAMKDYVRQARVDELAEGCFTVASDASEVAVGGGLFEAVGQGEFVCTRLARHMLRIQSKSGSSALRELEGIIETALSLNLPRGSRIVLVVDNEAVFKILQKGSGREELQVLARFFFKFCVQGAILATAVWQRRSTKIMKFCDTESRVVDRGAFSAHPALFWEANRIAMRLWGRGFTYDRFASSSQVQPIGCCWKLPFSSWCECAFASGTDAFSQQWTGHINWVNAPFGVLGQVLALLREQRAVAAVVVPRGWRSTRHWWAASMQAWSEGVVHRWCLHPQDFRCQPVNCEFTPLQRKHGLAVVFFDFRRRMGSSEPTLGTPAEIVHRAWVGAGRPGGRFKYHKADGGWELGLPFATC